MSNEIVIDIETQNIFAPGGQGRTGDLKVSIACIYDYKTGQFSSFKENELNKLWPILESAERIIGYNSRYFDLPVLNNYYGGDLSKLPQLDMLEEVKKSLGFRLKLDDLAKATLGISKSANGLQAVEWFKTGEFDKIEKYCLQDVKVTRELYEYGVKNRQLFFQELATGKQRPFPINFAPPAKSATEARHNINLTLPF
ncbi:MAG: ribonuclease H-like domain-containing protein [Patescibacteria group bacterium]